jgi:hypothetical protein
MAIDTTRTPYTLDINPIKQGDDFVETFVFSITELDLIDLVSAQIDFIDRNGVKKFSYTLGAGITKISQTLYLDISRSQTLTFEIGSNVYTYELELVIGNFKRTYVELLIKWWVNQEINILPKEVYLANFKIIHVSF